METAVLTAITDAGLAEGVRRTLKYAVEHHGVLEIPDDYNAENRLLESYYSTDSLRNVSN